MGLEYWKRCIKAAFTSVSVFLSDEPCVSPPLRLIGALPHRLQCVSATVTPAHVSGTYGFVTVRADHHIGGYRLGDQ